MQLIRPDINIDFVGIRFKAFALSGVVILIGLIAIVLRGGLNMGIDFSGGTLIQVKFTQTTTPDAIRKAIGELAEQSTIQQIGSGADNEFLIRTDTVTSELQSLSKTVENELSKAYGEGHASVRRVEMVGPKVGQDLRQKAFFAIYYALLLIAIYISGRFEFKWAVSATMAGVLIVGIYVLEAIGFNYVAIIGIALLVTMALCWILKLPYAFGALLSLVHDIVITVGMFAVTDREFSLEVIAALLTLAGYSLNDTIVVYDRIRENRNKDRKVPFDQMINGAINQTLSRTLLTNSTVAFVVLCMFFLGGTVIHDFAFALLIGSVAGSYSSIFVASPILIFYEDLTKRKRKPKRAATQPAG